jgi:hypothetical protein
MRSLRQLFFWVILSVACAAKVGHARETVSFMTDRDRSRQMAELGHAVVYAEAGVGTDTHPPVWEGGMEYRAFPRMDRLPQGANVFLEYGFGMALKSDFRLGERSGVSIPNTEGGSSVSLETEGVLSGYTVIPGLRGEKCSGVFGGGINFGVGHEISGLGRSEIAVDLGARSGVLCRSKESQTLALTEVIRTLPELGDEYWSAGVRAISGTRDGLLWNLGSSLTEKGSAKVLGEVALPLSMVAGEHTGENLSLTAGVEGAIQAWSLKRGSTHFDSSRAAEIREPSAKIVFGFRVAH